MMFCSVFLHRIILCAVAVAVVSIGVSPATGAEIRVAAGESIQLAIEAAAPGDVIVVEPGTYIENIDFLGKVITVRSVDPADPAVVAATVIDGGGSGSVVSFRNGEQADSVLSGFTVTNGTGYTMPGYDESGAGIYCLHSSPMISYCVITGNTCSQAQGRGGGVLLNDSSATIYRSTIENNFASQGGGIYCIAASRPVIRECDITNNTSTAYGGGIQLQNSSASIIGCKVSGNVSSDSGGIGIVGRIENEEASIVDTFVVSNSSTGGFGGGLGLYGASPEIANCLIAGNTSASWGGGLSLRMNCSPVISNCTIYGNTGTRGGGIDLAYGGTPQLKNSIVWNNMPDEIYGESAVDVTFSNVQGGYAGTGNVSTNPALADPVNGDYHLTAGSPGLDAGTNVGIVYHDLDGAYRPLDGDGDGTATADMGAYEYYDILSDGDGDSYPFYQDCDDLDPAINPGAAEIPYNGIDENCSGMADDDDLDLDGYPLAGDCDDLNTTVNPGAAEIPYNGIDENCSGMADDDDLDFDGYGIVTDCNESDPAINPGACDIKSDGIDQDCDGADRTKGKPCASCTPTEDPTELTCTDGADNDCDGLADSADPDCQPPVDCIEYPDKNTCNTDPACKWSNKDKVCINR